MREELKEKNCHFYYSVSRALVKQTNQFWAGKRFRGPAERMKRLINVATLVTWNVGFQEKNCLTSVTDIK
jgi:hypothetical protein